MTTHETFKEELLKDPEFRQAYEALKPKYKRIRRKLRRTTIKNKGDKT